MSIWCLLSMLTSNRFAILPYFAKCFMMSFEHQGACWEGCLKRKCKNSTRYDTSCRIAMLHFLVLEWFLPATSSHELAAELRMAKRASEAQCDSCSELMGYGTLNMCSKNVTADWTVVQVLDNSFATWKTSCFEEKKAHPCGLRWVHQSLCFTDHTSLLYLISHHHHLISRTEGCISLSDWEQAAFEIRVWAFTKPDRFGRIHTYHRE